MAAEPARHTAKPPCKAGDELYQRFGALLAADHGAILQSYADILEAMHSSVYADPDAREHTMANADAIICDINVSLKSGIVDISSHLHDFGRPAEEVSAQSRLNPADSLRAAVIFFEIVVAAFVRYVGADRDLLPAFVTATLALNESISLRVREATLAYTEYWLDRIHHAHLDERRRIARDLHDRLGEGLSVALRQLELYELTARSGPAGSDRGTETVKDALTVTMRRLRMVTSDLRQDSVTGLEKSLINYVELAGAEADVTVRITGDESWASPVVVDETFLIVRESIRNALAHGAPRMVLVAISVTPRELRARVEDDGCGFRPSAVRADPAFTGIGLASMPERAALIGGQLTVTSEPGRGTLVELRVPLSEQRDDEAT